MIGNDYVEFCNEAFDLAARAEGYLAKLSDEDLHQLQGLVCNETQAASGDVAPGYNFLKVMLDDEIEERRQHPAPAFRDAIFTFAADSLRARDDLSTALTNLPDLEWHRARSNLENWIERGCKDAAAYQHVIEMVDLERAQTESAQDPIDLPF